MNNIPVVSLFCVIFVLVGFAAGLIYSRLDFADVIRRYIQDKRVNYPVRLCDMPHCGKVSTHAVCAEHAQKLAMQEYFERNPDHKHEHGAPLCQGADDVRQ